jgi:hypothetical protein
MVTGVHCAEAVRHAAQLLLLPERPPPAHCRVSWPRPRPRLSARETAQSVGQRRAPAPTHLFEVKAPRESRSPWDLYKRVATTPGEQAFRALDQEGCSFIRS